MSQQRPRAVRRGGAWNSVGGTRLVLAACLIALVAAGLRGTVAAPAFNGPFRQHSAAFGIVVEGVLGCLLVALIIRHRRAPRDAVLAARLRILLTWVVVIAMVVIAFAYLPLKNATVKQQPVTQRPSPRPSRPAVHPAAHGAPLAVIIVLAILAALAAAGLVYLIVRLALAFRDWAPRRRLRGGVPLEASAGDDEAGLREAVESGYSALLWLDDARAAIIACYAAMEESLATAGAVRAAAETPDELLARAAAQGLVRGGAAARLTALFYEARFSSHPMPRERRDDAEQALRDIAASLAGTAAPASPAGTPGPAGQAQ